MPRHHHQLRDMRLLYGVLGLVFVLGVGLCTVTDIDRRLSALFYTPPNGWYLREAAPWRWLYNYGMYPGIVLAAGALLGVLGSVWRPAWAPYRRQCLVLVLSVALGPGLLVNGLLKPAWGRARPRQIEQFGGTAVYRNWWQPGGPGTGKSFPSGHAAMGFVLVAGVILVPPQRTRLRRVVLVATLAYGGLMSMTRIVQGGHFLSDVLWSGGVVALVVWILPFMLRPPGISSAHARTSWRK